VVGSDEERWGGVGCSEVGRGRGMGRGEGGHKNNFHSSSTEQNKKNFTSDAEKRNFSLSSSNSTTNMTPSCRVVCDPITFN